MECSSNKFCRSLPEEVRLRLCQDCRRRRLKKGQVVYRADIESGIMLVVDGVMVTQTDFKDDMLEPEDCPAFFIITNGLLLGIDSLFNDEIIERYEYISYICLSDAVTAHFPKETIRTLFKENYEFAVAMFQNITIAAGEACEFAAVLRGGEVKQSVAYLLKYAIRKGFTLTHQEMADITGHSRVSVTRAIKQIKQENPTLWGRYQLIGSPSAL